jgi:trans-aconitate 2-methyltransferase
LDIWQTTYYHSLTGGASGIVEWFKGTGLRPFLSRLDEEERRLFLFQYEQAVAKEYPPAEDGSVLLPFPRLFLIAVV